MSFFYKNLQKANQKARFFTQDILFATGLRSAEKILSQPGRRILNYHGLNTGGRKNLNGRFIGVHEFEAQVRFLNEHAQIISLDDYFEEKFDAQRFTVAITFDDGYQNNLNHALPILENFKAKATFFLTAAAARSAEWLWTDFLDVATELGPAQIEINNQVFNKKKWRHTRFYTNQNGQKLANLVRSSPWTWLQKMEQAFLDAGVWAGAEAYSEYWKLLTPHEIQLLASSRFATIGAHGYTHQDLAILSHEVACAELQACKVALEQLSGTVIQSLAYPFGSYTPALIDYAQSIGFTQQLAVDYLHLEDPNDSRLRDRLGINPYISTNNQWLAVKNGHY